MAVADYFAAKWLYPRLENVSSIELVFVNLKIVQFVKHINFLSIIYQGEILCFADQLSTD